MLACLANWRMPERPRSPSRLRSHAHLQAKASGRPGSGAERVGGVRRGQRGADAPAHLRGRGDKAAGPCRRQRGVRRGELHADGGASSAAPALSAAAAAAAAAASGLLAATGWPAAVPGPAGSGGAAIVSGVPEQRLAAAATCSTKEPGFRPGHIIVELAAARERQEEKQQTGDEEGGGAGRALAVVAALASRTARGHSREEARGGGHFCRGADRQGRGGTADELPGQSAHPGAGVRGARGVSSRLRSPA